MLGDWVQEQSAGFEIDTTLAECLRRSDHADCGAFIETGLLTGLFRKNEFRLFSLFYGENYEILEILK